MKKYIKPELESLDLLTEDVITASGDPYDGIVTEEDKDGANSIHYNKWNTNWN